MDAVRFSLAIAKPISWQHINWKSALKKYSSIETSKWQRESHKVSQLAEVMGFFVNRTRKTAIKWSMWSPRACEKKSPVHCSIFKSTNSTTICRQIAFLIISKHTINQCSVSAGPYLAEKRLPAGKCIWYYAYHNKRSIHYCTIYPPPIADI